MGENIGNPMDAKIGFPAMPSFDDCFSTTSELHCFEAYRLKVRNNAHEWPPSADTVGRTSMCFGVTRQCYGTKISEVPFVTL